MTTPGVDRVVGGAQRWVNRCGPALSALIGGAVELLDVVVPRLCAACLQPSGGLLCGSCSETLERGPAPGIFAFGGAVQVLVRAAKFGPDEWRAGRCAALLAERAGPIAVRQDAIAWVPTPWRRQVSRGFDLPGMLAAELADKSGVPCLDALACVRCDPPLSHGASREERAQLVRGRYRVRPKVAPTLAGRRVLLIDDVHTTGATLGDAKRALEACGAVVRPLTLAAVP